MGKVQNLSGNKYGKLTVISFEGLSPDYRAQWLCKCECGKIKIFTSQILKNPKTKSCGCSRGESHGESNSKEYKSWYSIKQRCTNPKSKHYRHYGGRGIKMCSQWHNSFIAFLRDMGKAPSITHSIDRVNNNGNYEPSNCRWATVKEQMNNMSTNRLIEFKGETKTMAQWCEYLNLNYKKIKARFGRNWTIQRALETP